MSADPRAADSDLPFQYGGAMRVSVGSDQDRMAEPREATADESGAR